MWPDRWFSLREMGHFAVVFPQVRALKYHHIHLPPDLRGSQQFERTLRPRTVPRAVHRAGGRGQGRRGAVGRSASRQGSPEPAPPFFPDTSDCGARARAQAQQPDRASRSFPRPLPGTLNRRPHPARRAGGRCRAGPGAMARSFPGTSRSRPRKNSERALVSQCD